MKTLKFDVLKDKVQEIINLIANKEIGEAKIKIEEVNELLDEMLDHFVKDDDLVQASQFQVLLQQLKQKVIDFDTLK
jgi:CRISPR/Cas system CSM-associated protein Csm2 small subunit